MHNRNFLIIIIVIITELCVMPVVSGCADPGEGAPSESDASQSESQEYDKESGESSKREEGENGTAATGKSEDPTTTGKSEDPTTTGKSVKSGDTTASDKSGESSKSGKTGQRSGGSAAQQTFRKAVYRSESGTRVTRKVIKKNGGASKYFIIYKIRKGDHVYKRINGKSYHENPDISLDDLRYIKVLHYDFDGKIRIGEIIVNSTIAKDTLSVFRELYGIKYQIRKMRLIDDYWSAGLGTSSGSGSASAGSATAADTASMNDDNTSGFNYRMVAGTSTLSMHGYGRAIDVNPFENPWCPGGRLYSNQQRSAEYANRGINTGVRKPHMIFQDSEITSIFKKHGFRWLGETGTRDYQHFEK